MLIANGEQCCNLFKCACQYSGDWCMNSYRVLLSAEQVGQSKVVATCLHSTFSFLGFQECFKLACSVVRVEA